MPAEDDELRDSALKFEAQKVRMSQDKDGWTLLLRIHPNDVQSGDLGELLTDLVGTRYVVAMVRLTGQDEPGISREQLRGKRMVASAGMLCANGDFQRWLYSIGRIDTLSEESAAEFLRKHLGIESRAHLATASLETKEKFNRIVSAYETHLSGVKPVVERRR